MIIEFIIHAVWAVLVGNIVWGYLAYYKYEKWRKRSRIGRRKLF